jgi:hypothetical protein
MAVASAVVALMLGAATSAPAFDGGTHSEITTSAMRAEGFGADAAGVVRANNWFCDLYLYASIDPFSGHAGVVKRILAFAFKAEDWPDNVVEASTHCHFESISDTTAVTAEWERLQRAVSSLAREARDRDDPEELLTVLGISTHMLQDFYAHANWVEAEGRHGIPGSDGPGWQEHGYGSSPTWFDIPAAVRNGYRIYTDESPGHRRHGFWDSDENRGLLFGMNKDWQGRPYYLQAATTAYFATRQWLEAVRSWVGDDHFWHEAQRYQANQKQLNHDLQQGLVDISQAIGHWQGQGEPWGTEDNTGPGGDLLKARSAVKGYFQQPGLSGSLGALYGKTKYRALFEKLLPRVEDPNPVGDVGPVPSSQPLQRAMRFVVLRVNRIAGVGAFGLGDLWPDQADLYVRGQIDGQGILSAVINDKNSFSFPRPNAPFTWLRAVPAVPVEAEPVSSVEVEIKTSGDWWSGTDDDVHLRLGQGLRFKLDKGLYNDFEKGDRDTYSVPIDGALENGFSVGDIKQVTIEKSPDGIAGGWKLGGVRLRVNGQEVYDNQHVNRWLEDDHCTWQAPDFEPSDPRGPNIPITLNIRDSDSGLFLDDDEGDINPFDNRSIVAFGYQPGTTVGPRTLTGGDRLGGRLGIGGDKASLTYSVETLTPEPMHVTDGPPRTGPLPDLVISKFDLGSVTVTNQGAGDTGPFNLRVGGLNVPNRDTEVFDGLKAGASETRSLEEIGLSCFESNFATADSLAEVEESDERNNTREAEYAIC